MSHLGEVARLFTKLGFIGFGGPAAHIALMRDEVVRRQRWVDDQTFLDLVGACNVIPGPNSTELAIHLGHRRAGWRGLLVGGACFIAPAVAIVLVIAVLYERYGTDATVLDVRYGVLPVIVAVVVHAVVGLGRTAIRDVVTGLLAAATVGAWLAGVSELLLLAVGAAVGAAWAVRTTLPGLRADAAAVLAAVLWQASPTARPAEGELLTLGLVFLKIGAVLYGSGYVLLAYLQQDFVERLGWLTSTQLLDAVAVGQVTPGPLFTTATFVGYQVAGVPGAVVATTAIFLPAFAFVALLTRIVPFAQRTPWARGALDGVNAVSLGLMAAVTIRLAGAAFPDVFTVLMGLVSAAVLLRWRTNTAWLVGAAVLVGIGRALIG